MLRVVVVVALLSCRHGAAPPTIANSASSPPSQTRPAASKTMERARAYLASANALAASGRYLEAYADAQRGLNLLEGEADLDNGALLEVSTTQASQDELVIMTDMRTRELERRISKR